jgi:hypothetical protein
MCSAVRVHEQMGTKVLLLEFNEICPPLLQRWLREEKLPNFKRLFDSSDVFVTVADEGPPKLEPWIQWYSIHTGLPYAEHGIFHLTDGPRASHIDLWRLVQQCGGSVMNCGSMNARGFAGPRAFFLPDPWCAAESSWPPETRIFAKIVSTAVQEYSNARMPLSSSDYLQFARFLITHGLSFSTVSASLSQLVSERFASRDIAWKRVKLLDQLQYDVFAHYYRQLRPDFATFFSNSTAHLQHAYWRHMDPDPFAIKPSVQEIETYGPAVFYGYAAMDRLIARFLRLVDEDTVVILCSALSQQPFLKWEEKGGQHFYRLHDAARFLDLIGTTPTKIEPVMTHQYLVRFATPEAERLASERLRAIRLDDKELFGVSEAPDHSLEFGCQIFTAISGKAELNGIAGRNEGLRFGDLLYPIQGVKSGYHHPEGVLWIGNGRHAVHREPVSILDIAPTICRILKLDPAIVDRAGFRGVDLFGAAAPISQRQPAYSAAAAAN